MKKNIDIPAQTKEIGETIGQSKNQFEEIQEKSWTELQNEHISNGKLAGVANTESEYEQKRERSESNQTDKMYNTSETNKNNERTKVAHIQSMEQNSEFARRRREKELKEKIEQARADAVIEVLDGRNPYTNEEIKTMADVQKYFLMKSDRTNIKNDSTGENLFKMAKVSDFQNEVEDVYLEKNANNGQKIENNYEIMQNNQNFCKDDTRLTGNSSENLISELEYAESQKREYLLKHSEEEYLSLMQNIDFLDYVSDKSKMSLEEKQAEYNKMTSRIEQNARVLASQILANKLASPGALRTDGPVEPIYLSREQVEGMSKTEIHNNYDKIKQSMKFWK